MDEPIAGAVTALFSRIARVIRDAHIPAETKANAFEAVENLASEVHRPGYGVRYSELMAIASDNPSVRDVLSPYLPALGQLLH